MLRNVRKQDNRIGTQLRPTFNSDDIRNWLDRRNLVDELASGNLGDESATVSTFGMPLAVYSERKTRLQ